MFLGSFAYSYLLVRIEKRDAFSQEIRDCGLEGFCEIILVLSDGCDKIHP